MSYVLMAGWYYLRNPFDNVSKNNMRRLVALLRDHHDKLFMRSTDPDIAPLYALLLPNYEQFMSRYAEVQTNWGYYQSETLVVKNLFADLTRKLRRWEAMVITEYDVDTPQYLALLPANKSGLHIGGYDVRLEMLRSFEDALSRYPNLSAIRTEVSDFRVLIEKARTGQQGYEHKDQHLRQELERSRIDTVIAMHRILGHLIALYAHDPARIETFFELTYLQSPAPKNNSSSPTLLVQANSRSKVVEKNLTDNTVFELSNLSDITLGFFVTNDENAATPADITLLSPKEAQTYSLADLSDNSPNPRYLLVVNMHNEVARYKATVEEAE